MSSKSFGAVVRRLGGVSLWLGVIATPCWATETGPPRTKVVIDHATGSVELVKTSGKMKVEDGDEKRVPISASIVVEVLNTNTALYAFNVSTEEVEAPEIAVLKSFLGALGPYFVELGGVLDRGRGPKTAADFGLKDADRKRYEEITAQIKTKSESIEKHLRSLDQLLASLSRTELSTLSALDSMAAKSVAETVEKLLRDLETPPPALEPVGHENATDACGHTYPTLHVRLTAIDALLRTYEGLTADERDLYDLWNQLAALAAETGASNALKAAVETAQKSIDPAVEAAKRALKDADTVLAEAYRVEALVKLALNARDTWCSDPIQISSSKGRKLTIEIAPRQSAELARLAHRPPFNFVLTLLPDWLARPGLGLAFVSSPDSVFPIYSTRKAGEQFEIVESDRQDSRFTYGLSLGVTWRGLDWRDQLGFAVWLPELTINPSDDVKAVGVGAAVSFWKIVKIGAGGLWTKHKTLAGQLPGQLLADDGDLRLKESYGKAQLYVSFALVGWPPFLQK